MGLKSLSLSIFELPSELSWLGETCLFIASFDSLFDSSSTVKICLVTLEMTSRGLRFDLVLDSFSDLLIELMELMILILELRLLLVFCLPLEVKTKN